MSMSFTANRKPSDEPHALLQIAREHYVGARLSFVGGAASPSQLAMHQCIETAAKASLKATAPGRQFGGPDGHKIRTLLTEVALTRPRVKALLDAPDTSRVVDVLEGGYNQIRYGKGVLGIDLGGTLNAFAVIAWNLLTEPYRLSRRLQMLRGARTGRCSAAPCGTTQAHAASGRSSSCWTRWCDRPSSSPTSRTLNPARASLRAAWAVLRVTDCFRASSSARSRRTLPTS